MSRIWKFRDPKYLRQQPRNQGFGNDTLMNVAQIPTISQIKNMRARRRLRRETEPKLSLEDLNKILWPSGKDGLTR